MNPPIEFLPIDRITVGKRVRRDYGDIDGLAESIQLNGLLHPLIVDDDGTLIAGERRLRAVRQLGLEEVPVRRWGHLDAQQRREIELEENLQRLNLSTNELERSRAISRAAELAAEIDKEEIRAGFARISAKTKPQQPGSLRRVSERIDIPPKTIQEADAHVAIADEFPTLGFVRKTDAVKIARKLNGMTPEERAEAAARIRENDAATIATLADKPVPIPDDPPEIQRATEAGQRWKAAMLDIYKRIASVNHHGGVAMATHHWLPAERKEFLHQIDDTIGVLTVLRNELQEVIDEQQSR